MASIRLDIEADGYGEFTYTNSSRPNKLSGDDRDAAFSLLCTAAALSFRVFRPQLDKLTNAARDLAVLLQHHEAGQSEDGRQDAPTFTGELAALNKFMELRRDLRMKLAMMCEESERAAANAEHGPAIPYLRVDQIRKVLRETA